MAQIIKAVHIDDGNIPPDFPIIVDRKSAVIEPVFEYLYHLAVIRGRTRSPETIRTYAESLHDFFDSLEQSGFEWRRWKDVNEELLAAYRNGMRTRPSPATKRPYAPSTINQRLRNVSAFYRWAFQVGKIRAVPFQVDDVYVTPGKKQHMLSHKDVRPTRTTANNLTVREYERQIRPLTTQELRRFRTELSTTYQLIADWMLTTGIRRKEAAGLEHIQIPESDTRDSLQPMLITITKGDKPRDIFPNARLIARTNWYIMEDRFEIRKQTRRNNRRYEDPDRLFLTQRGTPVSPKRITETFRKAFRAAGIFGVNSHCLRHTFAVTTLAQLQRIAAPAQLWPQAAAIRGQCLHRLGSTDFDQHLLAAIDRMLELQDLRQAIAIYGTLADCYSSRPTRLSALNDRYPALAQHALSPRRSPAPVPPIVTPFALFNDPNLEKSTPS